MFKIELIFRSKCRLDDLQGGHARTGAQTRPPGQGLYGHLKRGGGILKHIWRRRHLNDLRETPLRRRYNRQRHESQLLLQRRRRQRHEAQLLLRRRRQWYNSYDDADVNDTIHNYYDNDENDKKKTNSRPVLGYPNLRQSQIFPEVRISKKWNKPMFVRDDFVWLNLVSVDCDDEWFSRRGRCRRRRWSPRSCRRWWWRWCDSNSDDDANLFRQKCVPIFAPKNTFILSGGRC